MKVQKLFLVTMLLICCASVSFAQIKITSNGKVGIGTTTPNVNYKTTIADGKLLMKFGNPTGGLLGTYDPQFSPVTAIVDISPVIPGTYPTFQYTLGRKNPFQYGVFDMLVCNLMFHNFSDERLKRNINSLSFDRSAFAKLQPVSYEITTAAMLDAQKDKEPTYMFQYGFIAQELQKIYPHLVTKDEESDYLKMKPLELIPILVAAIQDQQKQIDELKAGNLLRSGEETSYAMGISFETITGKVAILYQNVPNPFNQSTEIKFYVPENAKSAQLCIYNLQGKQIKQIVIIERGEGTQVITGSELSAGMYLYALIVDGKEIDTKRMILTE